MRGWVTAILVASGSCGGTAFTTTSALGTDASADGHPSGAGGGGEAGPTVDGAAAMRAGCSDGTREEFTDEQQEPDIAGCAGGFSVPAVTSPPMLGCARLAGNDSANPQGRACTVEDLCAQGWHVCRDRGDVASRAATHACQVQTEGSFWLTRQSEATNGDCVTNGHNNLVGCGKGSGEQAGSSCAPLDTAMRYTDCQSLPPWQCGTSADTYSEADVVTKSGPAAGGVLCCRD